MCLQKIRVKTQCLNVIINFSWLTYEGKIIKHKKFVAYSKIPLNDDDLTQQNNKPHD